jgi:plastocyanin
VANFPDSPGIGSVFVDTTSGFQYKWTGVVWKSFTAAAGENIFELDDISSGFNNSTTTFNLTRNSAVFTPQSAAQMQISLGGVVQEPSTDYTVSGSTITFTTAPNAGLDFFGVVRGTAVAIDYANDGNVQTKQEFTATEGQTSFTITGGYTAGYIDVFRNGVRLAADDITITSGTAVVLATPAQAGDIIETVKYEVASLVVSQGNFTNQNISGVATVGVLTGATSVQSGVYYGDGSQLTGIDATAIKDSGGTVRAQANVGGVVITGVATATTFVGNLTGNVTGNTSGTAGGLTGTPNITVGSVNASSGTFSGNVSVGGTLTYQDVTNMDVLGIGTFQQGIQVLANGVDVTGIGTFEDRITYDGSLEQAGGGTVTYAVTVASKDSTHRYNGQGSGNAYVIDNLQAPVITVTPGRTYRFTNDNTGSHPLKFYYQADKTTLYETGVTFDNAYTEITITDTTPAVLHYQCTSHSLMGNSIITQSNPIVGAGITLNADGGGVHVTGVATATGFKVGAAISISDGAVSATRFHGDGGSLTGISVGISTEEITATDRTFATLNLSKDVHKVNVSGVATIDCQGGTEYETHVLTIVNTGIATVGFSTYFLFPSGSVPSLPTASGTISQISFTVHRVGAAGTQVLTTAALNFS